VKSKKSVKRNAKMNPVKKKKHLLVILKRKSLVVKRTKKPANRRIKNRAVIKKLTQKKTNQIMTLLKMM
jgi:hypothetical protein